MSDITFLNKTGNREDDVTVSADSIAPASFDALKYVIEHRAYLCFTWPNDPPESQPLLVDMFTANAMLTVYRALSEANQEKFRRMVGESRARLGQLVDFTWKAVK